MREACPVPRLRTRAARCAPGPLSAFSFRVSVGFSHRPNSAFGDQGGVTARPAPQKLRVEPPDPARRARRLDPTTGTQPHQNAESVAESTVLVAQTRSIRKNPSLLMSNCGMWLQGIHQVPSLVCWWPIGYTCDLPLGFDWERAIRSNTSECDRGRYADGEFAE